MATRNRTATFIKYRDAVRASKPLSAIGDVELDMPQIPTKAGGYAQLELTDRSAPPALPPVWVDLSEKVKEEMQRVRQKMPELAKAQARALLPSFDTSANTHDETIELLTQDITRSLKKCEKSLQRLTQDGGADENKSIAKNVQRSMATDLHSLSMDFRKQSKKYLQRLEQQEEGPPGRKSKVAVTASEDDEFFDPGFSDRQTMRVKSMENVSAEREQEVIEIVSSVNELAQILKDLSVLVIDQGTVVDRIEYNIQTVGSQVDKGVKQLAKAENSQKRTAMLYCIMLLVVLCILMLVMLILKTLVF